MSEPITVLIVDDHEMVREGTKGFLETQSDIVIVAEAESGLDAVRFAQEFVPDVVLMDLVMPEMDGIEATRRIKEVSPRTQIIVLTSYHQDDHIFPALQAGAISYLLKDIKSKDLVLAIYKAAKGEATLNPKVASRVLQQFNKDASSNSDLITQLTGREVDVLTLIARGYTNQKIAEDLVISLGTVKGHVSNILSKLHLVNRTSAALFAWQEGVVSRGMSE
ncbi:MAG: response regulator transcription factor [Chloroflexota bacterium]